MEPIAARETHNWVDKRRAGPTEPLGALTTFRFSSGGMMPSSAITNVLLCDE